MDHLWISLGIYSLAAENSEREWVRVGKGGLGEGRGREGASRKIQLRWALVEDALPTLMFI